MEKRLIIRGKVQRTEQTLNDELKISFKAECLYNGNLGKIVIVKTITNRNAQLYGEIITGTSEENQMVTKLYHAFAGTPFDMLSGTYVGQTRIR